MAEFRFELVEEKDSERVFDCDNKSINELVRNSFYVTIAQQGYAYRIVYKDIIVGYYMISLKNIDLGYCPDDISDYADVEFRESLPSVHIDFIAIDKKYQDKGLGTYTLKAVVASVKSFISSFPIRLITLDAVFDREEWYSNRGFQCMKKNYPGQEGYNVFMYLDCIKDKEKLVDYIDRKADEMS